jgi:glutaryl-CoA dehydrogenase
VTRMVTCLLGDNALLLENNSARHTTDMEFVSPWEGTNFIQPILVGRDTERFRPSVDP